ncbi:hypothetical protein FA95DRAFT_1571228 [Auriscalpium vulgare]|uniref:Uncharacterized protein n=1 Tax=Auriscalpium vulgare TaxID=40419 RepID=A0ACB8S0N6_9AGAM|nr:hypothetical protein FA95DRAFT_1571228 [Auriscalpium vulgare]
MPGASASASHTPPNAQGGPSPGPLISVPDSAAMRSSGFHDHHLHPTSQAPAGVYAHNEGLMAGAGAPAAPTPMPGLMSEYGQDVAWRSNYQHPSPAGPTTISPNPWDDSRMDSSSTRPSPETMASLVSGATSERDRYYPGGTGDTYNSWGPYGTFASSPSGGSGDSPVHTKETHVATMYGVPGYPMPGAQVLNWSDHREEQSYHHLPAAGGSLPVDPRRGAVPYVAQHNNRRATDPYAAEQPIGYPSASYSAQKLSGRGNLGKRKDRDRKPASTDGEADMVEDEGDTDSDLEAQKDRKKKYAQEFRYREKRLFEEMRKRLFPQDPSTKRSECMEKAIEGLDELDSMRIQARERDEEIESLKRKLHESEVRAELIFRQLQELRGKQQFGSFMG